VFVGLRFSEHTSKKNPFSPGACLWIFAIFARAATRNPSNLVAICWGQTIQVAGQKKSRNVQSFQTSGNLLYFAMFLGLTVNKPGYIPALISPEGEKEKPDRCQFVEWTSEISVVFRLYATIKVPTSKGERGERSRINHPHCKSHSHGWHHISMEVS